MRLLKNGTEAFAELLSCMASAKKTIHINMFIWRDDAIGRRMASALLDAADRGVSCFVSLDRVGALFEYAEESRSSLFHKSLPLPERLTACGLSLLYPHNRGKKEDGREGNALYARLSSHPRITLDTGRRKSDHSKYYVFDDRVLILGGVNIEDKENGVDARGLYYQDYMVRLDGEEFVSAFYASRERRAASLSDPLFLFNQKEPTPRFPIPPAYTALINEAERELTIVMAYFSDIRPYRQAILDAAARGVAVSVVLSGNANFQDSANKRSARDLMRASDDRVRVFLSPLMLHTKLVLTEKAVCLGSCNMAHRSHTSLDELNLLSRDAALIDEVREDVTKTIAGAHSVSSYRELTYPPLKAVLEGLLS